VQTQKHVVIASGCQGKLNLKKKRANVLSLNSCLLYFKNHDHISKSMLFYPKDVLLVSMLEYLSTTYLLCMVVVLSKIRFVDISSQHYLFRITRIFPIHHQQILRLTIFVMSRVFQRELLPNLSLEVYLQV
jgi:hypothetical protein